MATYPSLSLLATFDDICRYRTVLAEGIESDFLRFAGNQDECRWKWLAAETKVGEISEEVKATQRDLATTETRLKHVRSHLESEIRRRKEAEYQNEQLERQIHLVRELLFTDQKALNNETREKLAFLNFSHSKRETFNGNQLEPIGELDSTGSILSVSSLSYDQSEEDLENSILISGKSWKTGKRPSLQTDEVNTSKRRRSANKSQNKSGELVLSGSHVIATTTLTIPTSGPVTANAVVEAKPVEGRPNASKSKVLVEKTMHTNEANKSKNAHARSYEKALDNSYAPTAPPASAPQPALKGRRRNTSRNILNYGFIVYCR